MVETPPARGPVPMLQQSRSPSHAPVCFSGGLEEDCAKGPTKQRVQGAGRGHCGVRFSGRPVQCSVLPPHRPQPQPEHQGNKVRALLLHRREGGGCRCGGRLPGWVVCILAGLYASWLGCAHSPEREPGYPIPPNQAACPVSIGQTGAPVMAVGVMRPASACRHPGMVPSLPLVSFSVQISVAVAA
jgi:hypothetical protein